MAKITVSHLGKIADASVTIAPLNILVGKNNTGKTYMANLIWAVCHMGLSNDSARRGRRSAWLSRLLKPIESAERRTETLDATEAKRVFNSALKDFQAKLPAFLGRVFAYEGFNETSIGITPDYFGSVDVSVVPNVEQFADNKNEARVSIHVTIDGAEVVTASYPAFFFRDFHSHVYDRTYYDVFGIIAFGTAWIRIRNPTYIPAARTGLMLSLSSLVDEAMDYTPDSERGQELPLPLAQFLRRMQRNSARAKPVSTPSQDLVLEKLVDGVITSRRGAVREYRYRPHGIDLSLPLHAVSSMITELAPLIIDMRSYAATRHIIFEEPEAHLHLEAQREMARVIARLVNEGTYVTMTTHSDTFLQQINNLTSLYNHPNRSKLMEKFGYESDDLINPDNVEAFEFCPSQQGTEVRPVKRTDEGFVVPTLNSTLLALARETVELRGYRND